METETLTPVEALAPAIARALSDLDKSTLLPWTVKPYTDGERSPSWRNQNATLEHPSGRRVYLHTLWNKKTHLHVSLGWPETRERRTLFPRDYLSREDWNALVMDINVSAAKSPEKIAQDINRRLMLGYVKTWDFLMARKAKQERANADSLAAGRALAAVLGERLTDAAEERLLSGGETSLYGGPVTFQVRRADSIKVEMYSLNLARTLQLAALALTWAKEDKATEDDE